ncbi:MAG: DUF502 domain-containing protein [Planctomycetes bacterium]|nr:DUF502 domain-containing protein [Planctomycetota bacterium]
MAHSVTKRAFLKGLAALLPTMLTVFILVKAYEFVSNTAGVVLTGVVAEVLDWATPEQYQAGGQYEAVRDTLSPILGTLLALVIAFVLAVFVGLFLASYIGRKIWGAVEKRVFSFPVIRSIYPSVKQVTDFVFGEHEIHFKRAGLIEYPRKGVYSIGFITGNGFKSIREQTGRDIVTFFIPSSPTPFTGYCVQVPRDDVMELDVPVEAVIRYTVSGGVILPAGQVTGPEDVRVIITGAETEETSKA